MKLPSTSVFVTGSFIWLHRLVLFLEAMKFNGPPFCAHCWNKWKGAVFGMCDFGNFSYLLVFWAYLADIFNVEIALTAQLRSVSPNAGTKQKACQNHLQLCLGESLGDTLEFWRFVSEREREFAPTKSRCLTKNSFCPMVSFSVLNSVRKSAIGRTFLSANFVSMELLQFKFCPEFGQFMNSAVHILLLAR